VTWTRDRALVPRYLHRLGRSAIHTEGTGEGCPPVYHDAPPGAQALRCVAHTARCGATARLSRDQGAGAPPAQTRRSLTSRLHWTRLFRVSATAPRSNSRSRRPPGAPQTRVPGPVAANPRQPSRKMTLLAPIYKFYFDRVAKRLARVGLQYHDAIAETGVYDKSLSRMSPEFQASAAAGRPRRRPRCAARAPLERSARRPTWATVGATRCVADWSPLTTAAALTRPLAHPPPRPRCLCRLRASGG
jgi:hypothetical protein